MEKIQVAQVEQINDHKKKLEIIIAQHLDLVSSIKAMSQVQGDMAKQIVKQHEDTEALYLALGLKKDLSYYSYDMPNQEEH